MGLDALSKEELLQELKALEQEQAQLQQRLANLHWSYGDLEENAGRYRDLFDFAPMAYLRLDASGIIRDINLTGATMLRRERESLINRLFVAVVKIDSALFNEHLRQCSASRAPYTTELAFTTFDGLERREVQLVSVPELAASGRVRAFRTTFTDISQRRLVEAEVLRVSDDEHRLRRRFEALDSASVALTQALANTVSLPADELLRRIAEEARRMIHAGVGAVAIGSDPSQPFVPFVVSAASADQSGHFGLEPRPVGVLGRGGHRA